MNTKSKLEKFIEKAILIHGLKFGYNESIYNGARTKLIIICPHHGPFLQTPNDHLSGCGCPKCSKTRKISLEEFINEANKIHNFYYDYSEVIWKNCTTKITIICSIHGKFLQQPHAHLMGRGCQKCGGSLRLTLEEFIEKANKIHNFKFGYEKIIEYINGITKVIITCPLHGDFEQTPAHHLNGCGCPKCGGSKRLTLDEFISRANEIHDGKYEYEKIIEYINNATKVIITCPLHGDFEQTPAHHLNGCGCPKCKESQGERKVRKYLIKNNISFKYQHWFKDCRYKYPLPFDFAIFKNTKFFGLIEYQGEQHYNARSFGSKKISKEENLEIIKRNDQIKLDYCIKNNIPLLRIPYTDIKNIPELIDKFIGLNDKNKINNTR